MNAPFLLLGAGVPQARAPRAPCLIWACGSQHAALAGLWGSVCLIFGAPRGSMPHFVSCWWVGGAMLHSMKGVGRGPRSPMPAIGP